MNLKLNIYKNRVVEKTYSVDEFDIMFGTVEDIVSLIDFNVFSKNISDADLIKMVMPLIGGGFEQVKNLLKEIFPELNDEELKRVKIKEIIPLLVNLVSFSLNQISSVGSGKN